MSSTGTRSPRPATCGWSTLRIGATTTSSGPDTGSSASGWVNRRSTASRRPTVSDRGLSRSCGSVSHAGKTATRSSSRKHDSDAARSSASRPVAVTASTGRWARLASAATRNGRSAAGPVTSSEPVVPSRAASTAAASAGSDRSGSRRTSSRPVRLIRGADILRCRSTRAPIRTRTGVPQGYVELPDRPSAAASGGLRATITRRQDAYRRRTVAESCASRSPSTGSNAPRNTSTAAGPGWNAPASGRTVTVMRCHRSSQTVTFGPSRVTAAERRLLSYPGIEFECVEAFLAARPDCQIDTPIGADRRRAALNLDRHRSCSSRGEISTSSLRRRGGQRRDGQDRRRNEG